VTLWDVGPAVEGGTILRGKVCSDPETCSFNLNEGRKEGRKRITK
jgi:hypothetical protein